MKKWWAGLDPGWREVLRVAGYGFPISYLTYIGLGVAAIALGVPMEIVGYGAKWNAIGLVTGTGGAAVGFMISARIERRRNVSADSKEE